MRYKTQSSVYTFKPFNYENQFFGNEFGLDQPNDQFGNFHNRGCNCNPTPMPPRPPVMPNCGCNPCFRPPQADCKIPPFLPCECDNFRYFIIGYFFGRNF